MNKYYFTLKHNRTGQEYYKTVASKSLADAVRLVSKYYPHYTQVSIREV